MEACPLEQILRQVKLYESETWGLSEDSHSAFALAVAYLVVSLYPICIVRSGDNILYIQAYRHLYVLAARTKFTDKIDIVSNRLVSCEKCHSLRYQRRDEGTPSDIPEFEYINGEIEGSGSDCGGRYSSLLSI